jgi:hypothetical protein
MKERNRLVDGPDCNPMAASKPQTPDTYAEFCCELDSRKEITNYLRQDKRTVPPMGKTDFRSTVYKTAHLFFLPFYYL